MDRPARLLPALCALALLGGPALAAEKKPSLIVINIDDLGYCDIGPFGSSSRTPNLDRMAREGRKLASHYAAPLCTASRTALMTGCYPKRALPIAHVLFPSSSIGLNPAERTIAEVLKDAGYATACFGKWHLGDQPAFLPTRQGFDTYFGLPYSNDMGPAEDGAKSSFGKPLPAANAKADAAARAKAAATSTGVTGAGQPPLPLLENEKVVARVTGKEQAGLVRQYTEHAVKFIREKAGQPFFLYLPHTAVHFPHYPSESFRGKSPNGLLGDWAEEVDWSVGQVLDTLRELKLDQNTLVLFTSDNGGSVPHGSINKPLRGSKGETWEGGIRVPTIAWWPGKIPAGTTTDAITSMMDILPTLAGLGGGKVPADRKIDGVDIWPVLAGTAGAQPPREEFFYFAGLNLEAVRSGPWKLRLAREADKKGPAAPPQLFNLAGDIGESKDVAAEHPDVVERLQALAGTMKEDLGWKGVGPGCRAPGRVENPVPLLPFAGEAASGK